jgi:hypothetical protein
MFAKPLDNREVELRFGTFTTNFSTTFQEEMLSSFLANHRSSMKKTHQIIKIYNSLTPSSRTTLREINDDGTVYYQIKTPRSHIDFHECCVRIAESEETNVETRPQGYSMQAYVRERTRYSFKKDNIRFDISEYTDASDVKTYEVEAELTEPLGDVNELKVVIGSCMNELGLTTMNERTMLCNYINTLNVDPAQPVPLTLSVLSENSELFRNYAVTAKIDGMRKLLVFLDGKVFSVVGRLRNPDVKRMKETLVVGRYTDESYEGMVLEGEYYYDSDIHNFYLFDVVVGYNKMNTTTLPLRERHKLLNDIVADRREFMGEQEFDVVLKNFFFIDTNTDFYTASEQALKSTPDVIRTDGLIYQHSGKYTQTQDVNFRPYKWKPIEDITIDFRCCRVSQTKYSLSVLSGKQNVEEVFGEMSYSGSLNIDKAIVECKYDVSEQQFTPFKIRYDKPVPNTRTVAQSNYDTIINPVNQDVIVGRNCLLMKKLYSITKEKMISQSAMGVVVNIGNVKDVELYRGKAGITEVIFVEQNEKKIDGVSGKLDRKDKALFKFVNAGIDGYAPKTHVDTVVAFFSLSYIFEDTAVFAASIKNICSMLKYNGKLLLGITDFSNISERIGDISEYGFSVVKNGSEVTVQLQGVYNILESKERIFNTEEFMNAVTKYFNSPPAIIGVDNRDYLSHFIKDYDVNTRFYEFVRNATPFESQEVDGKRKLAWYEDVDYDVPVVGRGLIETDDRYEIDSQASDVQDNISQAGSVGGEEQDDANIEEMDELDDDERVKREYDKKKAATMGMANKMTPPTPGSIVNIELSQNNFMVRCKGVDVGKLNIIHAARESGITTKSVAQLHAEMVRNIRTSFFKLDGGYLAGGYQSRILERDYGGYTIDGGVAKIKGLTQSLTIEKLDNLAETEFTYYILNEYLGERSAAELLSICLDANIFIVDLYKPNFDWSMSSVPMEAIQNFVTRAIYNPVLGRIASAEDERLDYAQFLTKKSIFLFTNNNITYFPVNGTFVFKTNSNEYLIDKTTGVFDANSDMVRLMLNSFAPDLSKLADPEQYNPMKQNVVRVVKNTTATGVRYGKMTVLTYPSRPLYSIVGSMVSSGEMTQFIVDSNTQFITKIGRAIFEIKHADGTNPAHVDFPKEYLQEVVRMLREKYGSDIPVREYVRPTGVYTKYVGCMGELYESPDEVRLYNGKRLSIPNDIDISNLVFVNCPPGVLPDRRNIPKGRSSFEWPERERYLAVFRALTNKNIEDGKRDLELAIGKNSVQSFIFTDELALRDLRKAQAWRDIVVNVGDSLSQVVSNNPAIFPHLRGQMYLVNNINNSRYLFPTPRNEFADGEIERGYLPPQDKKYQVNVTTSHIQQAEKEFTKIQLKGLIGLIRIKPTPPSLDNVWAWVSLQTEDRNKGTWKIVNQETFPDQRESRNDPSIIDMTDPQGVKYIRYVDYDMMSFEDVQNFQTRAKRILGGK